MTNKNPVVEAAREKQASTDEIYTRHGVRGRLIQVSISLVQDMLRNLEMPEVPIWEHPEKGRKEENPNDPKYLRALEDFRTERGVHTTEAMLLHGIELLDPLPEDKSWLNRLQLMHKLGTIDLSWVEDWDDPITQEFLFKRYVWSQRGDIAKIDQLSSVEEAAQEAAAGF